MAKLQPAGKINVSRVSATKERQVGKVGQQIGIKPSVAQVQEQKRVEGELAAAQNILGQAQTVEQYEIQFGKLTAEQKSYFSTPQAVREKAEAEKQAFIKSNISRADSEIARYNERIKQAQEKIAYYKQKEQERGRDYGDSIDKYKDDIREYTRYINYLNRAKVRYISQGVSFSDANRWVDSEVDNWKKRREERANQIGFVPGITTGTITTETMAPQTKIFDSPVSSTKISNRISEPVAPKDQIFFDATKFKDFKKVGEIYNPSLGGFVQPNKQGQLGSETSITRIPTIEEQKAIISATESGSYKKTLGKFFSDSGDLYINIKTKPTDFLPSTKLFETASITVQGKDKVSIPVPTILPSAPVTIFKTSDSVSIRDIQSAVKTDIENLPTKTNLYRMAGELDTFSKGKVEGNLWVGSEKEFEEYQKRFAEYEAFQQRVEDRTSSEKWLTGGKELLGQGIQFLPSTSTELGAWFVGGAGAIKGLTTGAKIFSQLPKGARVPLALGWKGFDWTFTGLSIKEATKADSPYSTRLLNLGFAGLGGIGVADDLFKGYGKLRTVTATGYTRRLTLSEDLTRAPFTRPRATIILRDSKGRVLTELDKNTGLLITPGGAVDKGEDFLKAAERELFEETGLKGIKLQKIDDVLTSRERNVVFEGFIDDVTKGKLKPQAGEVVKFEWVKPPKKFEGSTPLNVFDKPAQRLKFWQENVRADDLFVISRAEKSKKVTSELASLSPSARKALESESFEWGVKTFGKNVLKRTSKEGLAKDFLLSKQGGLFKELIIGKPAETFLRRGKPVYLARRTEADLATTSFFKDSFRKVFKRNLKIGKQPGTFAKFQDEPGIVVGFGSRYDVPYSALKKFSSGRYTYIHGGPVPIPSKKGFEQAITGQASKAIVKGASRGENVLYFQPPTQADKVLSESYLGASYLGIFSGGKGSTAQQLKFSWTQLKPRIYRASATLGDEVKPTLKAIRGKEFEVGAQPGTGLFFFNKGKKVWLGGKKVRIVDTAIESSDDIALLNQAKKLGDRRAAKKVRTRKEVDLSEFTTKRVTPYSSLSKTSGLSRLRKSSFRRPLAVSRGKTFLEKSKPTTLSEEFKPGPSIASSTYKVPGEKIKPSTYTFSGSYLFPTPYKITPLAKRPSTALIVSQSNRITSKKEQAYYAEAKAKGGKKFIRLTEQPVSKSQALDIGSRAADETTARTFRIVPSNKKIPAPTLGGFDWALRQQKFRPYKIRRKARIQLGNTYIEKTGNAIDTSGEARGLSLAKYIKKRRNPIGNLF